MTISYRLWTNPQGVRRIYVNGIPGLRHFETPYFSESESSRQGGALTTAQEALIRPQNWAEALAEWEAQVRRKVTPFKSPFKNIMAPSIRATLEAAKIVHLAPAARMAGLKWKNGQLSHQGIVDAIMAKGEAFAANTCAILARLQKGLEAPAPAPKAPEDWFDEGEEAPAPIPTPTPSIDLSAYVPRVEWNQERIAEAAHRAAGDAAAEKRISALQAEIESLRALRPVEIRFPEKPEPIRIEGTAHPQFTDLCLSLRAGLHCMLVGPAGSGKTYSAEQAAQILGRRFYMNGAVSYAHELLGYVDAHSRYVRTQFREAFEHGGLILLDEFDASAPEAALVLNAALANGACSFPDGLIRKHPDFLCIVGANTDGSGATMAYSGRARLDGAFLDRFVVFDWQIDPKIEEALSAGNSLWLTAVRAIRAFAVQRGILDVVATPRATARGALLQSQGMAPSLILSRTCKRGALIECWRDVESLPAVAAFLKG